MYMHTPVNIFMQNVFVLGTLFICIMGHTQNALKRSQISTYFSFGLIVL